MRETAVPAHDPAGPTVQVRLEQLAGVTSRALPVVALVAGALFVASQLNHGWVPWDDGTLAQSAQRVLLGELPHRDFAELYTGGLTFVNAGVLWVAGDNLLWLRVPMFLAFLVYLPCFYGLARRFAPPAVATLAVLFAVAWGPPVYPAAMPSWYTLYFAVIGAFALVRHRDTRRARWLVLAGAMGGLSVAFKITGVWYAFAVVLYFLFSDWSPTQSERRDRGGSRFHALGYRAVAVGVPVIVLAVVGSVLTSKLGPAEIVNLLLPVTAVCAVALWSGVRLAVPGARERALSLVRVVFPFVVGFSVPLALLAVPYAATGSLGDLYAGTLVTPQERLHTTYIGTAGPAAVVFAVPVIAVVVICMRRGRAARGLDRAASAGALVLLASTVTSVGYLVLWHTTAALLPTGILLGVALLVGRLRGQRSDERPVTFLLLALAAFLSLVQFPFSAPVYFCFVAPLALLAWLAMFHLTGFTFRLHGVFPLVFLGSLVAFGFVVSHGVLYREGLRPMSNPQTVILDRRTAWVRVTPEERSIYQRAALLLRRHSTGAYIYAGPDTPELYVLSGRRNPTRALFDLLDPSRSARGAQLFRTLDERHVSAIAVNPVPAFSEPLAKDSVARLRAEYPHYERVGSLEVRWRSAATRP